MTKLENKANTLRYHRTSKVTLVVLDQYPFWLSVLYTQVIEIHPQLVAFYQQRILMKNTIDYCPTHINKIVLPVPMCT